MSRGQGFYIQKRKTRDPKRNVYYVQFIGADGKLGTAVSTHETSKDKAERWAQRDTFTLAELHQFRYADDLQSPRGRGLFPIEPTVRSSMNIRSALHCDLYCDLFALKA